MVEVIGEVHVEWQMAILEVGEGGLHSYWDWWIGVLGAIFSQLSAHRRVEGGGTWILSSLVCRSGLLPLVGSCRGS